MLSYGGKAKISIDGVEIDGFVSNWTMSQGMIEVSEFSGTMEMIPDGLANLHIEFEAKISEPEAKIQLGIEPKERLLRKIDG